MICLAAAAASLTVFGAAAIVTNAFLAKTINELDNVITPGSVKIMLTEPEWNRETAEDLLPEAVTAKDPTVTNVGENDAWVFLRVDVPVRSISVVDTETKRKRERQETELFSFVADESWTLVSRTAGSDAVHYVYGYNAVLKSGKTTEPLFTEVTLVNYLEGELDGEEELVMPVTAVAVQSNVESAEEGLSEIYNECLAQEAADEQYEVKSRKVIAMAGAGGTDAELEEGGSDL